MVHHFKGLGSTGRTLVKIIFTTLIGMVALKCKWLKSKLHLPLTSSIFAGFKAMYYFDRGYFFSTIQISKFDPVGMGWRATSQKVGKTVIA